MQSHDMQTLRIYPSSVNDRFIERAADILRRGGVMIFPTDTLYAIGCSALSTPAIDKVCRLKRLNPLKNTLSIICSDISQASEYARIDNKAFALLRAHTPGPYTFILPASQKLPKAFKGRHTVGVRIPDNPISRRLAEELGAPILTTSIPSEGLSDDEITHPAEITLRFESSGADLMIDGGQGSAIPSTVVDITDSSSPEVIRQGAGDDDF
ncbi:MAG: L-threonylcarbamoyladenylate synthase [Paramuribaculum sp.]